MQTPLSRLREALKLIRNSAKIHQQSLQKSEAATRAALIDPILRELGWDIADPMRVEIEKSVADGRVDYVLKNDFIDGEPVIFVEAKKLGERLEDSFVQIFRYACHLRVENMFLTDGINWLHFTNISPTNQSPTHKINLAEDDLAKAAAYFIANLDAALILPEAQPEVLELTDKIEQLEIRIALLEKNGPIPVETTGINEPSINWLPLDNSWDARKKKPTKFRLPDGHIIDVRSWTQVLVAACKYALTNNDELLNQLPIPHKANGVVKLIDRNPPENLNYSPLVIKEQQLYVLTNFGAPNCIANAAYIIGKVLQGTKKVAPALILRDE